MARPGYVKQKNGSEWDAVSWIQSHPEDIPIARENLQARDKGFDNDNVRQLMAAICLKACVDYKYAISRGVRDTKYGKRMMEDCHKFFGGDIFQFFVNGMSVDEIEKYIRATPDDAIKSIWKNMEVKQVVKSVE